MACILSEFKVSDSRAARERAFKTKWLIKVSEVKRKSDRIEFVVVNFGLLHMSFEAQVVWSESRNHINCEEVFN